MWRRSAEPSRRCRFCPCAVLVVAVAAGGLDTVKGWRRGVGDCCAAVPLVFDAPSDAICRLSAAGNG